FFEGVFTFHFEVCHVRETLHAGLDRLRLEANSKGRVLSMSRKIVALYVFSLSLTAVSLPAQVTSGTILGSVTDPSRAGVGQASVTVLDVATGLPRKVLTAADGSYVVPNLKPGEYRVTVSAAGFNT